MNNKNRFRYLVFTLGLLTYMLGCSDSKPPRQEHQNAAIDSASKRGALRVGYLVWAPCVTRDPNSRELGGIYVDMIKNITNNLELEVEWIETNLSGFAAGLNTGQFDICVGPTFTTIPRSASVNFTQPVCYVGNSAVVRKSSDLRPKNMEELNTEDITIAILQGQALEEYCSRYLPKAKLLKIAGGDLTAPLSAVLTNNADIGFMNSVTVEGFAQEHQGLEIVFDGINQVEVLPLSWSTRGTDFRTLSFLNSSIDYLMSTGRIKEYQDNEEIKLLFDMPKLSNP